MTDAPDALLLEIARHYVHGLETLETRYSDDLDVHTVSAWALRNALAAAYAACRAAAGQEKRP